jgi:hypothetical protein
MSNGLCLLEVLVNQESHSVSSKKEKSFHEADCRLVVFR